MKIQIHPIKTGLTTLYIVKGEGVILRSLHLVDLRLRRFAYMPAKSGRCRIRMRPPNNREEPVFARSTATARGRAARRSKLAFSLG
jgi:hypothetical protein